MKLTGNCWSWMKLFFQKCFYSTTWPVLGEQYEFAEKKTFFSILIAKVFHSTCKWLSCCPTIRITPMMLARKPLDHPIPFVCTLEGSQKWQTRLWTSALFRTSASNVNNFFSNKTKAYSFLLQNSINPYIPVCISWSIITKHHQNTIHITLY